MNRNLKNMIDAFCKRDIKGVDFYVSDYDQLLELSGMRESRTDLYTLIANSLCVGFEVGYRTAEREMKKAKK